VEVFRANGLEIAYERVGEGPPLVFVHGAASDARLLRPQLAALGDELTVRRQRAGRASKAEGVGTRYQWWEPRYL
jgi:pimeloyl-ACP methyl ester carboxylesterase